MLVIEAGKLEKQYWKDMWEFRELFYFLSWRNMLVRYKQTIIGISWSIIQPICTMLIFSVIFGKLANLPSDGVPYPILVFSALLPWQFFSNSMSDSSNSLVANAAMISKIYFPRIIILTSAVFVKLIDFFLGFVILIILMVYYKFTPTWNIVFLPLFLFMVFFLSIGLGLWFGALYVKYRDFRYIVPFMLQIGMFVSPVGFTSSIVPEKWKFLYSLNPMVGVIEGFRWCIIGKNSAIYWPGFLISIVFTIIIVLTGILYFRKNERIFADVI